MSNNDQRKPSPGDAVRGFVSGLVNSQKDETKPYHGRSIEGLHHLFQMSANDQKTFLDDIVNQNKMIDDLISENNELRKTLSKLENAINSMAKRNEELTKEVCFHAEEKKNQPSFIKTTMPNGCEITMMMPG